MKRLTGTWKKSASFSGLNSAYSGRLGLGFTSRLFQASRQIVLVQGLPDQRLDDGLAAHIEFLSSLVQLFQHSRSEVYVDALNWLNHAAFTLEETGTSIFPLSRAETRPEIMVYPRALHSRLRYRRS
jgi:hypothetical protein